MKGYNVKRAFRFPLFAAAKKAKSGGGGGRLLLIMVVLYLNVSRLRVEIKTSA